MQQFAIIFLSILLEALPFVLIGTIISSLIEIFITHEWLASHLPKRNIFSLLIAGLAGLIFPICECAIVPIMRRLVKKGLPVGVAVSFMLATPTINPIVLLSTHFAFPNNNYFPILRGVIGYLTAISVGTIIAFLHDKSDLKKSYFNDKTESSLIETQTDNQKLNNLEHEHHHHHEGNEECGCGHIHSKRGDGFKRIIKSIIAHTSIELYEVGRFLILGALISSAMQVFVPKQYYTILMQKPALSIIMMMVLAFVLSLCSEADAFIAATFQARVPNQALLAFLVFGPMMDIKNMLMLSTGFKAKFILKLIIAIGVVTFIFSSLTAFIF